MSNPAKHSFGLMAKKACALLMVYCFYAASLWSLTTPGEHGSDRYFSSMMSRSVLGSLLTNPELAGRLSAAGGREALPESPMANAPSPVFTNFTGLNAPVAQGVGGTTTVSFFGPINYEETSFDS